MTQKTCLITGATRGIGRELARQLASQNVRVFATGRDSHLLDTLKQETGCLGQVANLSDADAVLSLYETAKTELGAAPDFLVNNAGFNSRKAPLVETTLEEFDAQYAVNVRAPYLLCREALKDMAARQSGHIVNLISTVVHHGNETMGVYTTTKHALHGLHSVLVKEARNVGVKATAVYPGGVFTTFRKNERPDYMSASSTAQMVVQVLLAPQDVVVHELTFRPMVEKNF